MKKIQFSKKVNTLIILLIILGFISSVLNIILYEYLQVGVFMIWNLFLAFIPLILSIIIVKKYFDRINILLKLAWLLFFPNATYLITDFIHIKRYDGFFDTNWNFLLDFSSWLGLTHLVIVILIGVLFGYISLYLLQSDIDKKHGNIISWIFSILVLILSSIGMFLGRFLRFNTWDIFKPLIILKRLYNSFDINIIFIFFIMIFIPYLIFYFIIKE